MLFSLSVYATRLLFCASHSTTHLNASVSTSAPQVSRPSEPHAAEDDVRNVAYNEMPQADDAFAFDEAEMEKWNKLIAFRDDVNKALEGARNAKTIGKPLEAHVTVYTDADTAAFMNGCGQDLADLCIVSEMDVVAGEGEGLASEELPGLTISVVRAAGEKCLRCWKQAKSVGSDAAHPALCARCAKVVG